MRTSVTAVSCNEIIVVLFYCQFVFMISKKMLLFKVKADVIECVLWNPKIFTSLSERKETRTQSHLTIRSV